MFHVGQQKADVSPSDFQSDLITKQSNNTLCPLNPIVSMYMYMLLLWQNHFHDSASRAGSVWWKISYNPI